MQEYGSPRDGSPSTVADGNERPAPKRVRKNPDTRRAEIVATAREVFAATGYAESGLAEIASAASVSKGLLYHYFPEGRPQLFVSVMQGLLAEFQQRLRQASKMPFSPRTRMEHLLAALFGFFDENPSAYRLLFRDPWVTHDDDRRGVRHRHPGADRVRARHPHGRLGPAGRRPRAGQLGHARVRPRQRRAVHHRPGRRRDGVAGHLRVRDLTLLRLTPGRHQPQPAAARRPAAACRRRPVFAAPAAVGGTHSGVAEPGHDPGPLARARSRCAACPDRARRTTRMAAMPDSNSTAEGSKPMPSSADAHLDHAARRRASRRSIRPARLWRQTLRTASCDDPQDQRLGRPVQHHVVGDRHLEGRRRPVPYRPST